jgi:predicted RecA/RadA family phage recombinase
MATATFVQTGNVIDYTPSAAVSAGDVVVQGDLVGVAKHDIAADDLGGLAVAGVFDFPKATGVDTALAVGTTVYWDESVGVITDTDDTGANKAVGKTVAAAGDSDAAVRVRLSQ